MTGNEEFIHSDTGRARQLAMGTITCEDVARRRKARLKRPKISLVF